MFNLNQESAISQPIPLNIDLAQSLAQSMHNLIKQNSHTEIVSEINNNIDSYLSKEINDLHIDLPNKKESFLFLSKNFEIITTILEICKNARNQFPNAIFTLYYDNGEDQEESTLPSLVLYIKEDNMTKEIRNSIRDLSEPYEEIFARYNTFFHTEPYLSSYV